MYLVTSLRHSLLSVLCWILVHAAAISTNLTIDDAKGDPVTGFRPSYLPPGGWAPGNGCKGCQATKIIDPSRVFGGTWHDSTYSPGGPAREVILNFTGTAVYVYHVIINKVPHLGPTTLTNLTFYLDDVYADRYLHVPEDNFDVSYRVPVYVNPRLSNEPHVLRISADGVNASLLLFDYVEYTVEDSLPASQSAQPSTPTNPSSHPNTPNPFGQPPFVSGTSPLFPSYGVSTASAGMSAPSSSSPEMEADQPGRGARPGVVAAIVIVVLLFASALAGAFVIVRRRRRISRIRPTEKGRSAQIDGPRRQFASAPQRHPESRTVSPLSPPPLPPPPPPSPPRTSSPSLITETSYTHFAAGGITVPLLTGSSPRTHTPSHGWPDVPGPAVSLTTSSTTRIARFEQLDRDLRALEAVLHERERAVRGPSREVEGGLAESDGGQRTTRHGHRDEKLAALRSEVASLRRQVEYEKRLLAEILPRPRR